MIEEILIRFRFLFLTLIVGLTCFSIAQINHLKSDYDFSKDYPEGDPDYALYKKSKDLLGSDDLFIIVGIQSDVSILDKSFLSKVVAFTDSCYRIPYLLEVKSITNIEDVYNTPFGLIGFPFISIEDVEGFKRDSFLMADEKRILNRFVSNDFKSTTVLLHFEEKEGNEWKKEIVNSLESILSSFDFKDSHILGTIYFEVCVDRSSKGELAKNMGIGLIILIFVLFWIYRSFWGVMLPSLVYIISTINYLGFIAFSGHPLTIYSSFFPPILLIVTISDVLHFLNRYEENLRADQPKTKAISQAIRQTGLAIFLTSLLMAIGFWTFITFPIEKIKLFGLDMGIGIMICFLVTICILPAILLLIKKESILSNSYYKKIWTTSSNKIYSIILKKGKSIRIIGASIILIGLWSAINIKTGRTYKNNWPANHPFERSVNFFESNKYGTRTLEIAIMPKGDKQISDLDVLREIERLQNHLDSLPYIYSTYSPVSLYKGFHKIMDLEHKSYVLPINQNILNEEEDFIIDQTDFQYSRIMNESKSIGKISARMSDLDSELVLQQNNEIESWILKNIDNTFLSFDITGKAFMSDLANNYAVKYIFSGLFFSFILIAVILFIFFKNIRVVILILIVNILPIFITIAIMNLLNIHADLTRSIVFNMVFILALDDTIHYFIHYQQLKNKGLDKGKSILQMLSETGKVMTLTTILLVCAFGGLVFSDMTIARDIGILICCTSISSLMIDLFVAPWAMIRIVNY